MKLIELDPRSLVKDGVVVGFIFHCPIQVKRAWWQSCFFAPTPIEDQEALIAAELGEDALVQYCNPACGWKVVGEDFNTVTVTPSLDGSAGGLWHGFITAGQIVGGI